MIITDPLVKDWAKPLPLDDIDEELRDLVHVMNILPGIRTIDCCIGHPTKGGLMEVDGELVPNTRWRPATIFFHVHPETDMGLFVLTRASDRRYWRFGGCWSIQLSVGDALFEDIRPTTYCLTSAAMYRQVRLVEEHAVATARGLVASLWWHLMDPGGQKFREYYKLPSQSWWAKHWPDNIRGELGPEEREREERVSHEIDTRFFPDELALRR